MIKLKDHKNKWIAIITGVCILIVIICFLSVFSDMFGWFSFHGQEKDIEIPESAGASKIASILKKEGVITHPLAFRVYLKATGKENGFSPGIYSVTSGAGYARLEHQLKDANNFAFLIPEGYTLDNIAGKLQEQQICTAQEFLETVNNPSIYLKYDFAKAIRENELKAHFYAMEGYVFPSTYYFTQNMPADTIADIIFKKTDAVFKQYQNKLQNTFLNFDQVITLASIIEKEAGTDQDRPLISSVLYNRLRNPTDYAYLGCSCTTAYARTITDHLKADNRNDESIAKQYDTMISKGLPPGPICNPGTKCIDAAITPAQTSYFYFCSNLNTRETFYAETLSEHLENLKKISSS